jgi:hypothetical protein
MSSPQERYSDHDGWMMEELLRAKRQLDEKVEKVQEALKHVQRLQGLLPICMYCHKIRTDEQSWQRIEYPTWAQYPRCKI